MIYLTNLVEFTLSFYYFIEFTNYAPKSSPTFPGSVMVHIKSVLALWGASIFMAIFFEKAIAWIGNLTVLLTVLTFASPLAAVRAVLETQSSESIPWPFTLAALGNCILWMIVGIWELHDIYVYFPAVLGFLLAILQVALKLHFGDHMNTDHPHYMRGSDGSGNTASQWNSNPLLSRVRQMVNYGNTPANNDMARYHYSGLNDLTSADHDLQLDLVAGTDEYRDTVGMSNTTTNYTEFNSAAGGQQPSPGNFAVPPPVNNHNHNMMVTPSGPTPGHHETVVFDHQHQNNYPQGSNNNNIPITTTPTAPTVIKDEPAGSPSGRVPDLPYPGPTVRSRSGGGGGSSSIFGGSQQAQQQQQQQQSQPEQQQQPHEHY